MESSSSTDLSMAMKDSPNWLEMPHDLMTNILHRLGAKEILKSAQRVCTTWRRICKDPAMWKVIVMHKSFDDWVKNYDLETPTKHAIDLSCGELIDISVEGFGTDVLLDHILLRSNKLKRLCLKGCRMCCFKITGSGLSQAVKRVPRLEKLDLCNICIKAENIEVIGRNCPQLKSFKMIHVLRGTFTSNDYAFAIANSMPLLTHLELFDSNITNDGLQAILNGCPHLQSLHLYKCHNLYLGGKLGNLCMEQIENFKHDSTRNCEVRFPSRRYYAMEDFDEGQPIRKWRMIIRSSLGESIHEEE